MKLIFLDIDGTLTVPGENVPPESAVRAIEAARENGHRVFLSTGRNIGMCRPLMSYGFDGMIACAGGHVRYGDEVVYDHPMTKEQLQAAMEILHEDHVYRTLEALDYAYGDEELRDLTGVTHETNSELMRWRRELADSLSILPMHAYDGRPVYKIVIMCEKETQLDRAKERLESEFDFCMQRVSEHADCINGDLINRAFSKASGIRRLCDRLGISVDDTIAFGDSVNDETMLDMAGTAVCMGNGDARIKEKCDLVCPPVEQDGLAKAFEALHLI